MMMKMDEKPTRMSQKRPANDSPPAKKKRKARCIKTTVNLTQRISKAMKDVLVTTLDESFREECLSTLGVVNGSEAGKKIEELIVKFKDNKKPKTIKGKVGENQ